jgi:S1-C subfamily serine protease
VRPGSAAAQAGIRERDVIVEVGRKPVVTAEQAAKSPREANAAGHLVLLFRNGTSIFVVIPNRSGQG